MAFFDATRPAPGRSGWGLSSLLSAFFDWREQRETVIALSRLSDRELNDIGLSRADLEGITPTRRRRV